MAVGRFAPSPSGELHLGNLRTALVAWLMARSAGSAFALRIDDLDPVTSRAECAAAQQRDLAAIGIAFDGPVMHQSQRREAHGEAIERLHATGRVYECFCTRREIAEASAAPNGPLLEGAYPGTCRLLTEAQREAHRRAGRRAALRLDAGDRTMSFTDRLRGSQEGVVDDVVLRRNDGVAAYNLAVVVDDAAQAVEEVVRADDLLTSVPRQMLIAELLGLAPVSYAHVPLVLGPDGRRLAKRDGAVTLTDRIAAGASTRDVLAMLASSLGLCAPDDRPTIDDLLAGFEPQRLPTVPWRMQTHELGAGAR